MTSNIQQGNVAEKLALRFLEAQGLVLVKRNYRCRMGELDLVMRDGDYLVFVEVRSRHDSRYGTPAETVTRTKQRRLIRAAAHYLQRSRAAALPCRFDVVAVNAGDDLDWIKNAFQA